MTRKHFILLASVLRDLRPVKTDRSKFRKWNKAVNQVAEMCDEKNDRFDKERFVHACTKGAI